MPEILTGMDSIEARKAIADFTVNKGEGKFVTNFKLRDWIFSRQRYWGEPIPLVFCENCANKNSNIKRFVILHGRRGSSQQNFVPWLKLELEKLGYEVEAPDMPNSDNPNDVEQMEFVKNNCKIDETTCVVAHSFGGVVALRLLENGIRAGKSIIRGNAYQRKIFG
jgi:predicted alpha/beta-fold hydrolase